MLHGVDVHARYQAVNTHGPDGKNDNLRDQLDRMEKAMTKGFNRMDHQFGEIHDRQIQEAEDRQAVDSRLQTLDRRPSPSTPRSGTPSANTRIRLLPLTQITWVRGC